MAKGNMYNYQEQKAEIFKEENQQTFLAIRDNVHRLLKQSGAFTMANSADNLHLAGSTWTFMACVDRLVELGEIEEVPQKNVCGQDRIFIKAKDY